MLARGAFSPYIASGTIVVGHVVASVHSQWFLDGIFDRLGWTSRLPGAYQVIRLAMGRAIMWHTEWGLVLWLPCCLAGLQEYRGYCEKRPGCQEQTKPHLTSSQLISCQHALQHVREADRGEHHRVLPGDRAAGMMRIPAHTGLMQVLACHIISSLT